MSRNNKSIPVIVGVSILFLVPLCLGITISTALRGDEEEVLSPNVEPEDPFTDLESKQSIKIAPVPQNQVSGGGAATELPNEGIPTGTYSDPPASISSFGSDTSTTSNPLDDSGSSIERNRIIQENAGSLVPEYSAPAASNNFNRTEYNSLTTPLEDDDFLDIPESQSDRSDSISPVAEPLF